MGDVLHCSPSVTAGHREKRERGGGEGWRGVVERDGGRRGELRHRGDIFGLGHSRWHR